MNNDVVYDPQLAAEFADKNQDDVKNSKNIGCFHCILILPANQVNNYLSDGSAVCPSCGHKSVIPDASMPVTTKNLNDLYAYWYGGGRKKR